MPFTIPDKIPAGGSAIANLKLTEKGLEGEWTKSITLEADDQYKTRLTVPIARDIQTMKPTATPASAKAEDTGK